MNGKKHCALILWTQHLNMALVCTAIHGKTILNIVSREKKHFHKIPIQINFMAEAKCIMNQIWFECDWWKLISTWKRIDTSGQAVLLFTLEYFLKLLIAGVAFFKVGQCLHLLNPRYNVRVSAHVEVDGLQEGHWCHWGEVGDRHVIPCHKLAVGQGRQGVQVLQLLAKFRAVSCSLAFEQLRILWRKSF